MDLEKQSVATADYSFRELLRQFRSGAPSIQLKRLGDFTPINATVILSLNFLIVLFVESQVSTPWLYVWSAAQFAFTLGLLLYLRGRRGPDNAVPHSRHLSSIGIPVLLAAISGGMWGSLTAFIPVVPPHLQIALILIMLGMAAGVTVTLAPVQQAAIAFIVGCVLPATIYHLTLGDRTSTMLALMMVVYAAAMIGTSRVFHRALWRQVKAEEQARELQEAGLQQRIANMVNVSGSVNEALQSCLDEVCRYTGWPVAHVIVAANDGTGEFVSSGVMHVGDEARYAELHDLSLQVRVRPGESMSGHVLKTGKPIWSAAGESDADLPYTFDNSVAVPKFVRSNAVIDAGLKSYVGIPVIIGQQSAAVLEFASTDTRRPSRKLMGLLTTIANELGRAIERQNSQSSLQQSEQKFRTLIESSAQGMAVHLDGKFLYANEVGARSFGYAVEDFLALNSVFDVVHPDYRQRMAQYAQARLAGKNDVPNEYEFEGIHKDGHLITLQARSSAIEWQGKLALLMTSVDVTQRKQAEQAARREERRATDYLNIAGSIIFAMDTNENLTLLNRTGCRLLECEDKDVIGRNGFDLFVPEHNRERAKADFARWIQSEDKVPTMVGRMVTLQGNTRDVRWELVPLRDESGQLTGVLGSGQDMTEQQAIEAQLQQAQKMEAVGQLTSGIAHDFNNILMVVMGNLEMAMTMGGDDGDYLSAAMQGAQRGADLNRQLLTFSKQQILDAKPVDVNEIIRGMSGLLKRALGEDTKIDTVLHDEECCSKVDPAQLESAILNLALNARDATLGGGEILVETGIADHESFPEASEIEGEMLYILIRDNGSGMEPHIRDRAIEPFFTTKSAGTGSGLGLSMVFNFAQQAGGRLKISSTPNQGTDVFILLPCCVGEEQNIADSTKTTTGNAANNRRILVVEDQMEVSNTICEYLKSLGYNVIASADGEDALRRIEVQSGQIDIVLSDIVLPGTINGTEIVDLVSRSYPRIKTILMSGNPEKSNRDARDELPNVPFLRKPFGKAELAHALSEAFNASAQAGEAAV